MAVPAFSGVLTLDGQGILSTGALPGISAINPAERLARVFGTEEDPVNCSWFFKVGACRNGDNCRKRHNQPTSSETLLLPAMYPGTAESLAISHEAPWDDTMYDTAQAHLEAFYEDVFLTVAEYGEVEEVVILDNITPNLFGNVYVKYYHERSAAQALRGLTGRFYNGQLINAEFTPVADFREARCRTFHEKRCKLVDSCGFMHMKHIPRALKRRVVRQMYDHFPDYRNKKNQEPDLPQYVPVEQPGRKPPPYSSMRVPGGLYLEDGEDGPRGARGKSSRDPYMLEDDGAVDGQGRRPLRRRGKLQPGEEDEFEDEFDDPMPSGGRRFREGPGLDGPGTAPARRKGAPKGVSDMFEEVDGPPRRARHRPLTTDPYSVMEEGDPDFLEDAPRRRRRRDPNEFEEEDEFGERPQRRILGINDKFEFLEEGDELEERPRRRRRRQPEFEEEEEEQEDPEVKAKRLATEKAAADIVKAEKAAAQRIAAQKASAAAAAALMQIASVEKTVAERTHIRKVAEKKAAEEKAIEEAAAAKQLAAQKAVAERAAAEWEAQVKRATDVKSAAARPFSFSPSIALGQAKPAPLSAEQQNILNMLSKKDFAQGPLIEEDKEDSDDGDDDDEVVLG